MTTSTISPLTGSYRVDADHSSVAFAVRHMSVSTVPRHVRGPRGLRLRLRGRRRDDRRRRRRRGHLRRRAGRSAHPPARPGVLRRLPPSRDRVRVGRRRPAARRQRGRGRAPDDPQRHAHRAGDRELVGAGRGPVRQHPARRSRSKPPSTAATTGCRGSPPLPKGGEARRDGRHGQRAARAHRGLTCCCSACRGQAELAFGPLGDLADPEAEAALDRVLGALVQAAGRCEHDVAAAALTGRAAGAHPANRP